MVPHQNYKVQLWNKTSGAFEDTIFDMFEQKHWGTDGNPFTDFEANFLATMYPDEFTIAKLSISPYHDKNSNNQHSLAEIEHKEKQLDIQGFSEQGEVIFQYKNEAQNLTQTFGINLKKYIGSTNKEH